MWIYIEINYKGIVFVEWCVYFYDLMKLQNSEIQIKFFLFQKGWVASADGRNMPQVLKPNHGVLTLYDSFLLKAWLCSFFF